MKSSPKTLRKSCGSSAEVRGGCLGSNTAECLKAIVIHVLRACGSSFAEVMRKSAEVAEVEVRNRARSRFLCGSSFAEVASIPLGNRIGRAESLRGSSAALVRVGFGIRARKPS